MPAWKPRKTWRRATRHAPGRSASRNSGRFSSQRGCTMSLRAQSCFAAALLILISLTAEVAAAQQDRWAQLTAQSNALYRQGQYDAALPVAQEALRVAEAVFGPEHPDVATSLNNLGLLYSEKG